MGTNFSAGQKIYIDGGAAIAFGSPESLYQTYTAVTIASAGNWIIPAGYNLIVGDGTAAKQEVAADTSTWVQMAATGYAYPVVSDGYNFRILNSATTAITIHYTTFA